MTDATFAGTLPAWYQAGHDDAVAELRPYLAHTADCDTHKGEECCCGLAAILAEAERMTVNG